MQAGASGRTLSNCVLGICLTLAALSCGRSGPASPSSIVLITVDTLRADHLSTYRYFRETSPTLDGLAREAMLFETALTTMATTLPAHASLMTSTRTTTHGLKGNFQHLSGVLGEETGLRTVAEMLGDLGYATAAFVSAAPVRAHTGLQRGFATFDQPVEKERSADVTADRVVGWLEAAGTRPFFLWVHFFDPHRPRQPPAPYDEAFTTDESLVEFLQERAVARSRDRHLHDQINAYDGEILFTDSQIGRIFAALKARGDWRDSAVVVTGDHGEGLGQHDWMDHGRIHNEQLLVPLIIKFPAGNGPSGVRVPTLASLMDVVPTLVAALELPVSGADRVQFEGIDLLADSDTRPGVLSEQSHRVNEPGLKYSLTNRKWKYFHRTEGADELYDLVRDPHELEDVLERHPDVAGDMRDEILSILDDSKRSGGAGAEAELDEEVVQQLRALGYLGGQSSDKSQDVWKGMAVWGHEVREFRPCGSDTAFWVVDDTGELWERYQDAAPDPEPYTEIYVELLGEMESPPSDGFGADYPGMLRVQEVLEMISVDPGCAGDHS